MILALACILWVFAATATALLPMRRQLAPGLALLVAAPGLIAWIALSYSAWAAVFAAFAFLSMFRRPLKHLARHLLGQSVARPDPSKT